MISISISEIEVKIQKACNKNLPFVVYKRPDSIEIKGFFQKDDEVYKYQSACTDGFIIAPFNSKENPIIFPKNKCELISSSIEIENEIVKSEPLKNFSNKNVLDKENYIKLVQNTIDVIKSGAARKIVVSRRELVNHSNSPLFSVFSKACNLYPTAFVYVFYHPKLGTWLGASPEKLLSVTENRFETVALAGTMKFSKNNAVEWTDKEKDEQQCVTDYIIEKVKAVSNTILCSKPNSVVAGNVVHLKTHISGEINTGKNVNDLVQMLHPTPAVCGLPKDFAEQYIVENENYSRSFYTGYLGEIDSENCNLFVNLRCMEIHKTVAYLYVGGGITSGSNAENEWNETVLKSQAMKTILT